MKYFGLSTYLKEKKFRCMGFAWFAGSSSACNACRILGGVASYSTAASEQLDFWGVALPAVFVCSPKPGVSQTQQAPRLQRAHCRTRTLLDAACLG